VGEHPSLKVVGKTLIYEGGDTFYVGVREFVGQNCGRITVGRLYEEFYGATAAIDSSPPILVSFLFEIYAEE